MMNKHLSFNRLGLVFALSMAAYVLLPETAFALSPMGGVLCNVISYVYGGFGHGIATLAIISIAISAMIGKVSWGLALTVAAGIGVIFGGVAIAKFLLFWATGNNLVGCADV